jgi:RNA polymerase sigma factor (sigma-70 family)
MNNKFDRKQELKSLYRKWPDIKRFLKANGCSAIDAEDIFQEALVIFCRKCEEKDFQLSVDAFHYVKSTCKFLWYNQSRKAKIMVEATEQISVPDTSEDWLQKEMKLRRIEQAIQSLGQKCRELLTSFYGLGMSMNAIAQKLGLRNEKVAKAQKYRCLQKAKENALSLEVEQVEIL